MKNLTRSFLGLLALIFSSLPASGAEKIFLVYSPLKMSLKVKSLEAFARDNLINKDLDFYLQITGLTNQQKIDLRKTLVTKYEIDPVALSRFLAGNRCDEPSK